VNAKRGKMVTWSWFGVYK